MAVRMQSNHQRGSATAEPARAVAGPGGGLWCGDVAGGFVVLLRAGGAAAVMPPWATAEVERAMVEAEIARWCPPEEEDAPPSRGACDRPASAEAEQAAVEAEIARWCPPPLDPPAPLRRTA